MKKFYSFLLLTALFLCCKKENAKLTNQKSLFENITPSESGIDFTNSIIEDEDINYLHYGYIYNGSGVAAGDINNDGLTDLYFSSNLEFNRLYLNQGNLKFKDITESAGVNGGEGYKSGVTMADVNNDGWLDIFVCKTAIKDSIYRKKMLYINNQNGTFTDRIAEMGLDDRSYTTQAYFFDSDLDGDLDVYFVNHPMNFDDNNYIKPVIANKLKNSSSEPQFTSDKFYENQKGRFVDRTRESNVFNEAFGLSAVIGDFNNDQLPDIYVANDFLQPDYLYLNLGKNKFKESFSEFFQHCPFSSMGTDYADLNNDGCNDLIVVDMTPSDPTRQKNLLMTQNYDRFQLMLESGLKAQYSINSLQLGSCGRSFSDIAFLTGTAYTDWSWAPLIADFDNDGLKDIFVSNGYLHDVMHSDYNRYKLDSLEKLYNSRLISKLQWINNMPSVKVKDYLFRNEGNLHMKDVSQEWNSGPASFSHGAAYADLDNDGDLDLVICNVNDPVTVLKNTSTQNYIRFKLNFDKNHLSEAACITITLNDGSIQSACLQQTRGFLSKSEDILHFGLNLEKSIRSARISWSDKNSVEIQDLTINKLHNLDYRKGNTISNTPLKSIFNESLAIDLTHKENSFIDFKREPLLIHKLSEDGPAVSVADINADNLSDIYLGGSAGSSGKIFVQNNNGSFSHAQSEVFEHDKICEDVASLFVDVNGDKLLDLYVVSGGNEAETGSNSYQDRLYINKGNLKFEKSASALPQESLSGSCVAASDLDKDGDIDLFVGTRSVPGRYGEPPSHMLLINNKGSFTNEIEKYSVELNQLGMITDAQWADLDNDKNYELIVCGEFMTLSIFSISQNKLINRSKEFGTHELKGLWHTILITDINKDNYLDILLGNHGLNTHLNASVKNPLQLIYSDFDKNGSLDAILCHSYNSKSYPIHYRDRLLDQMVFLKKKFTRYEPYSNASIEDIFTADQRKEMKMKEVNTLASTLFINKNGKQFISKELPRETQWSNIRGMVELDYNNDNHQDLITTGNFYGTDAQFGRYDASTSCLLQGDSQGNFKYIATNHGGIHITGDIRGIYQLQTKEGTAYLISRNNSNFSILKKSN